MGFGQGISGKLREYRPLVPALIFIALVLALPFGVANSANILRDGDVSWHIAGGRWIFDHGRIPTTDPFSFTAFGQPWIDTEWLADIGLAGAFDALGYAGLIVLVAAALIALNAVIFFYLQPRVSPIAIAVALPALNLVLGRFVLARPHTLAWVPLALWTVACLRAAEKGRPPSLWWILILPVWSNMHASFPLAIPIAGAIGLDALNRHGWKHFGAWLVFGIATVIGLCLNANGLGGILQPFHISSLSILPLIGEWAATSPTNSAFFFPMLIAGIGALLWSRPAIPVGRLLLLLVMMAMALAHVRHQSSFAILAACIVPTLWRTTPMSPPVPVWALAGALPFLIARAAIPFDPPANQANPWGLIASIPTELRERPVFNEYSFGGPLILSGIKVFIDGRAEMYGDQYTKDYFDAASSDPEKFNAIVDKYRIDWVMMPWSEDRFVRMLFKDEKWCLARRDEVGLIAVKSAGNYAYLCRKRATARGG